MKFIHKLHILVLLSFFELCGNGYCIDVRQISMPLVPDITRADIYYIQPQYQPIACLVMCPGVNGNGEYYLSHKDLQAFADHYQVALIGLSFASDESTLHDFKGYYCASLGSGKLLLDAIDQHVSNGVPLLLYGFSGGAHFVSTFQESYPQRVMAWCAYTAFWWEEPKANTFTPPGIVACGKLDLARYASSFEYFQQGRRLGKPWCWLSLSNTDHAENDELIRFMEAYFGSILDKKLDAGGWFDINTKQKLTGDTLQQSDNVAWLPDNRVGDLWSSLHKPKIVYEDSNIIDCKSLL